MFVRKQEFSDETISMKKDKQPHHLQCNICDKIKYKAMLGFKIQILLSTCNNTEICFPLVLHTL